MKIFVAFFLFITTSFAQKPNVWIGGIINFPTEWKNTTSFKLNLSFENDDLTTNKFQSTDIYKNKPFVYQFYIDKPTVVSLSFLPPIPVKLLVNPNDSLFLENLDIIVGNFSIINKHERIYYDNDTLSPLKISGRGAKLNVFLRENLLFDSDSLVKQVLFKNMDYKNYGMLMDDLSDQIWNRYLKSQDTSKIQNDMVLAAITAQNYYRKKTHKDCPEKIRLELVDSDEARFAPHYINAIIDNLAIRNRFSADTNKVKTLEMVKAKFDMIENDFKNLPVTKKLLLKRYLHYSMTFMLSMGEPLVSFYDNKIKEVEKMNFSEAEITALKWVYSQNRYSRKLTKGSAFPPLTFLTIDSLQTNLKTQKQKNTIVMFWNSWCDSCKVSFEKFAKFAQNKQFSNYEFVTIALNNRFSSWKEFINSSLIKTNITHLFSERKDLELYNGMFGNKNASYYPYFLMLDSDGKITIPPMDNGIFQLILK